MLGLGACDSSDSVINPVANAGPDQTVGSNATVTLDGSGSGTLTYSWSQTANTTVTLSSAVPIAIQVGQGTPALEQMGKIRTDPDGNDVISLPAGMPEDD